MTDRIRWDKEPDPETGAMAGYVGTLSSRAFTIWPPLAADDEWLLACGLSDMAAERCFGSDPAKLKAEAERWLAEFTASIGAVFPERGGRVAVNEAALEAFIGETRSAWDQRDQEFCVGAAESKASAAEFEALVAALGIKDASETAIKAKGE